MQVADGSGIADLLHWRPGSLPVQDALPLGCLEPVGFLRVLSSSASFQVVVLGSSTQTIFHAFRRTPPTALAKRLGDRIVAEMASELGLDSETIVPHHQVPAPSDCENLKTALAERELSSDDLAKFCSKSGYSIDATDPIVAYHFLNYSYGPSLALIYLDEKDDHDAERSRIYVVARRKKLALVDRENLLCLVYFGKDDLSPTKT